MAPAASKYAARFNDDADCSDDVLVASIVARLDIFLFVRIDARFDYFARAGTLLARHLVA